MNEASKHEQPIETALGGAVVISRDGDGVSIHAPQSVWRTPADGPQWITRAKADLLMFWWHDDHVSDQGCCTGNGPWHDCSGFVMARIRGMHHTMFVVPMPYDPKHSVHQLFAVLDVEDRDSRGAVSLREGFDGYNTALLFAAARCAVDLATETGR